MKKITSAMGEGENSTSRGPATRSRVQDGCQDGVRMLRDVLVLLGAFVAVTALAELFGAANLGTAMTFGQIAVVLAATALIVRR
jgi:hypothetical protein